MEVLKLARERVYRSNPFKLLEEEMDILQFRFNKYCHHKRKPLCPKHKESGPGHDEKDTKCTCKYEQADRKKAQPPCRYGNPNYQQDLEEYNKALKQEIPKYGQHEQNCYAYPYSQDPNDELGNEGCTCNFTATREIILVSLDKHTILAEREGMIIHILHKKELSHV